MTDYSEFFLGSRPSVAQIDCFEIAHPDFSQTYRIVRNVPAGLVVTHDGDPQTDWIWDGVDDEVDFGNELNMARTTARSMFVWYSTTSNGQAVLSKQSAINQIGWRFAISSLQDQDFIICGPSGTQQCQVGCTPRPPIDGTEHHFGFTYNGSSDSSGFTFYLDSVAGTTNVDIDNLTSANTTNSEPLQVGLRGSTAPFEGRIRHLSVWNRELTAGEVAQVYGDGNGYPDLSQLSFFSDCIMWLKFDESDTSGVDGVADHSASAMLGTANFEPLIITDGEFTYDYYPARVMPIASSDDLVQSLSITLGDVGDVIAQEIASVWEANGMNTRPTITYRAYRSDDLSAPIYGPIELEIANVTTTREGCSFEARAPELNATRTGELYTTERFPMLRGFVT